MRVLYEWCAAVDAGKDVIAVAARLPGQGPDGRQTVKRTFKTFYGVLGEAARWLSSLGVTHVAMEATGIYSMPVYHALIEHGHFSQALVCNAGHVKNVPGRKTDLADAEWLAHLLECGLLKGSFIPPVDIKAARDVFRYRVKVVQSRTSEVQRLGAAFFTTAAHLASWTGLCPGNHESAGKRHSGRRRHGNTHLQSLLVECAWAAVRHGGYLKSLYHRHVMKWGGYRSPTAKKKAIIVVAHTLIVIIWHILATGKPYHELGADYFTTRLDPERETRRLIAKLEALGHQVTLQPAA